VGSTASLHRHPPACRAARNRAVLRRLCRAVGLSAVIAVAAGASSAAACELRVRWGVDPPFSMGDGHGGVVGLRAELTELALFRIGCRTIWIELPWARALREFHAGRLDVLPGALRTPEREAAAHWAEQGVAFANRLFVRREQLRFYDQATTLPDAWRPGLQLGVQIGVVYGPDYSEMLKDAAFRDALTHATARPSLWQMLDKGRVDGVLADEASARWELEQLRLSHRIVATPVVVSTQAAQVMFNKRTVDAALVERFRAATAAMDRDGSQARIIGRYLGAR